MATLIENPHKCGLSRLQTWFGCQKIRRLRHYSFGQGWLSCFCYFCCGSLKFAVCQTWWRIFGWSSQIDSHNHSWVSWQFSGGALPRCTCWDSRNSQTKEWKPFSWFARSRSNTLTGWFHESFGRGLHVFIRFQVRWSRYLEEVVFSLQRCWLAWDSRFPRIRFGIFRLKNVHLLASDRTRE